MNGLRSPGKKLQIKGNTNKNMTKLRLPFLILIAYHCEIKIKTNPIAMTSRSPEN